MKIALIFNNIKDNNKIKLNKIIKILEEFDFDYYVCKQYIKHDDNKYIYTNPNDISVDTDLIITLGGDGTILQAARDLAEYNYPIAGINLGSLGYLAEIEFNKVYIRNMLKSIKLGKYIYETRMMLDCFKYKKSKQKISYALNDIVIKSKNKFDTVIVKLYVNNKFVTKYHADGLIISTPTGSTAYNLSAGGPIIDPTTNMVIVTPICSLALGLGSIVFDGNDEIVVEMCNARNGELIKGEVVFDGVLRFNFNSKDKLYIAKSKHNIKFMKFTKTSFLEILRKKIKR